MSRCVSLDVIHELSINLNFILNLQRNTIVTCKLPIAVALVEHIHSQLKKVRKMLVDFLEKTSEPCLEWLVLSTVIFIENCCIIIICVDVCLQVLITINYAKQIMHLFHLNCMISSVQVMIKTWFFANSIKPPMLRKIYRKKPEPNT